MAYHDNLNPKQIRVLDLNEDCTAVKGFKFIPFNLLDWVHKDLKQYFTDAELIQACHDLDLTFNDLSKCGQEIYVSLSRSSKINTPSVYSFSEYKTNKKGSRGGYAYSTDFYSCKVPNDLCNGDIVLSVLKSRYNFLNKRCYNRIKTVDFDLKKFNTEFGKSLTDLPKQLHSLTVEQLLNLNSVSYDDIESKFKIFSTFKQFYFSPQEEGKPSLFIDIDAFIKGDWDAIEAYTRKYWTNYYNTGSWRHVEENDPNTKNRLSWIDDLFNTPDMIELKADIISIAQ